MTDHTCKIGAAPEETPVGADEPTFGLSPSEKELIGNSWKLVQQDVDGNGVAVLLTFFRDYPANLKYFPFRDTPLEQLAKEPVLKSHAARVMRDLTYCVENIQKPATVLHALKQNALNHRKRNIHSGAYDELRASVLKALDAQLGSEVFTETARATWDKALTVIFGAIVDVMNDGKCHCPQ